MKKCGFLIASLWLFAGSVLAQGTLDLSLETFLQLVMKNNPDVQMARKELEVAKAYRKEAWATALPKLGAEAKYNRNLLTNYIYIDMPDFQTGQTSTQKFKISFNNEYYLNAYLTQPIFSFKIGNALQAASRFEKTTRFAYEAKIQTIVTNAKKAFYQAILARNAYTVALASEQNARENYFNMKAKYDNGLASKLQLLQAEARWQSLIPETSAAKRNYDLALNQLKVLAGVNLEKSLRIQGELESIPPLPDSLTLSDVLARRPDYNALKWERRLRENSVRNELANYLPSLDGSVIYAFSARSDAFHLDRRNENVIVGLTLNIPIYSGGYTGAQVQKAKIELAKSDIQLRKIEDQIDLQLQNIYLRLREANQRVKAATANLKTAEQAYQVAQKSADSGLATQLELKDARTLYDKAKLGYYAAVYDYLSAYFDWEQATGNGNAVSIQ